MSRSPAYLPLDVVERYVKQAAERGVSKVARSPEGFLPQYRHARGRTEALDPWWQRRRDNFVKRHMAQLKKRGESLFDKRGRPSRRHLALIMWAYSPVPDQLETAKAGGFGGGFGGRFQRARVVRENPARTPTASTVAYVVKNRQSGVTLILVDAGRIVGSMDLDNLEGINGLELVEHMTQALHGWGPLLYTSVFTWMRRNGYRYFRSSHDRLAEAEDVWQRFKEAKLVRYYESQRYDASYYDIDFTKASMVARHAKLEKTLPPPPFVEVSIDQYEKHGPKGFDGKLYRPYPVKTPHTAEEWPAWPAKLAVRRNPPLADVEDADVGWILDWPAGKRPRRVKIADLGEDGKVVEEQGGKAETFDVMRLEDAVGGAAVAGEHRLLDDGRQVFAERYAYVSDFARGRGLLRKVYAAMLRAGFIIGSDYVSHSDPMRRLWRWVAKEFYVFVVSHTVKPDPKDGTALDERSPFTRLTGDEDWWDPDTLRFYHGDVPADGQLIAVAASSEDEARAKIEGLDAGPSGKRPYELKKPRKKPRKNPAPRATSTAHAARTVEWLIGVFTRERERFGVPQATLGISNQKVRREKPRDYAVAAPADCAVWLHPAALDDLDHDNLLALVRHELAHLVDPNLSESATDQLAERLSGARIYYDDRDVQTVAKGQRPRPSRLPEW